LKKLREIIRYLGRKLSLSCEILDLKRKKLSFLRYGGRVLEYHSMSFYETIYVQKEFIFDEVAHIITL
jgi:hypothetical protein